MFLRFRSSRIISVDHIFIPILANTPVPSRDVFIGLIQKYPPYIVRAYISASPYTRLCRWQISASVFGRLQALNGLRQQCGSEIMVSNCAVNLDSIQFVVILQKLICQIVFLFEQITN
jgi:hypothetical protein